MKKVLSILTLVVFATMAVGCSDTPSAVPTRTMMMKGGKRGMMGRPKNKSSMMK
jgi:photosystem II stability/assembly factor-like uncharacterized protein